MFSHLICGRVRAIAFLSLGLAAGFSVVSAQVPTTTPRPYVLVIKRVQVAATTAAGHEWDNPAFGFPLPDLQVSVSRREPAKEAQLARLQNKHDNRLFALMDTRKDLKDLRSDLTLIQLEHQIDDLRKQFSFNTQTAEDTVQANFDAESIGVSNGDVVRVRVLDMDPLGHDLIGETVLKIDARLLAKPALDLKFGQVLSLTLEIKEKVRPAAGAEMPRIAQPAAPAQAVPVEEQAASALKLAEQLIALRPAAARERLREIVRKYPETPAAAQARELLPTIKD